MPSRRDIFVNGGIYHIFSKTIDRKLIFEEKDFCLEFLGSIDYYKKRESLRYSKHKQNIKNSLVLKKIGKSKRIEILSYCLMSNHYHLMIKQLMDRGIIRFMADTLNSFTRYYNSKNKRKGSIFLTPFRSRKIVSDEQFIHTSRYIHLNPYSADIVNTMEDLINYPYSSFKEYVEKKEDGICNTEEILKIFGGSRDKYKEFVLNNAEHQRMLEYIKYAKDWL